MARKEWETSWDGLPDRFKWEIDRTRQFLLEGPTKAQLRPEIEAFFQEVSYASFQDSLLQFRNSFEQAAEKELASTDWMAVKS